MSFRKIKSGIVFLIGSVLLLGGCLFESEKGEKYIPKPYPVIIKEPVKIELDFGAKLGASIVVAELGHLNFDGIKTHSTQNCELKTHAYLEKENRYFNSTTTVEDDKYFCVVRGRIISKHARLGSIEIQEPTGWYTLISDTSKTFYYPNYYDDIFIGKNFKIQFKSWYLHIESPKGIADTFYLAVFDTSKQIKLQDEKYFDYPFFLDDIQTISFTNSQRISILDTTMHFPGWE